MPATRIVLGEARIGHDEHHGSRVPGAAWNGRRDGPTVRSVPGDDVDLTCPTTTRLAFGSRSGRGGGALPPPFPRPPAGGHPAPPPPLPRPRPRPPPPGTAGRPPLGPRPRPPAT